MSSSLLEKQTQLSAMQARTEELEANLKQLVALKRQVDGPQGHWGRENQAVGAAGTAAVDAAMGTALSWPPEPGWSRHRPKCLVTVRPSASCASGSSEVQGGPGSQGC